MRELMTFEELVADNSFRSWVLSNRVVDNDRWAEKVKTETQTIEEAAQFVQDFQFQPKTIPTLDIEAAWADIDEQISQPRISSRRVWLRTAAAAILMLITASTFWFTTRKSKTITQSTEYGKQLDINLPDNSLAQLNANSELTFKDKWKVNKKRAVELKGQAFFKVQSTKDKATFTVKTKEFDVEVLGTQFDVIARDGHSSVAVREGTVKVRIPINSLVVDNILKIKKRMSNVILNIGEKLTFRNGKYFKSKIKPSNVSPYKISLESPTIKDYADILTTIHGYEISYNVSKEKLKEENVSNPNIDTRKIDILKKFIEAFDVTIKQIDDKHIEINE